MTQSPVPKFAIGGVFRITEDGEFDKGDEVKVLQWDTGVGYYPYLVQHMNHGENAWVKESDLEDLIPAPPLPVPPKFSSPEEADAWLERQANPNDRYTVLVTGPNGGRWLCEVMVIPNAPDPIATVLSQAGAEYALSKPRESFTSPQPF